MQHFVKVKLDILSPKALGILAVSFAAFGAFLALQPLHLSSPGTGQLSLAQNCDRPPGFVLMVLDNTGFNDSLQRGQPRLEFQRSQTVNILVCNLDSVQAHGFAIDHYFDSGVTLRPGTAYRLSFIAKDSGSFTVYCDVFCTVHRYMLGTLTIK